MKATVLFTRSNKFNIFSYLIQKVQNFPASHSAILVEDSVTGIELVYEATFLGGTRVSPISTFLEHNEIVFKVKTNISLESLTYMILNLNVKYSTQALFGFALKKVFKLKVAPFSDNERGFVCSEYVHRALLLSDLEDNADSDNVDVRDLYIKLKEIEIE